MIGHTTPQITNHAKFATQTESKSLEFKVPKCCISPACVYRPRRRHYIQIPNAKVHLHASQRVSKVLPPAGAAAGAAIDASGPARRRAHIDIRERPLRRIHQRAAKAAVLTLEQLVVDLHHAALVEAIAVQHLRRHAPAMPVQRDGNGVRHRPGPREGGGRAGRRRRRRARRLGQQRVVGARPDLHEEARVGPGAAGGGAGEGAAAVGVRRYVAFGLLRAVLDGDALHEDRAVEVRVEAVVLGALARVVQPQRLVRGERQQVGGERCAVWICAR